MKIFSLKQILLTFPITFAQLKRDNTVKEIQMEIRHIIHSLYHAKSDLKKIYDNL